MTLTIWTQAANKLIMAQNRWYYGTNVIKLNNILSDILSDETKR